MAIATAEQVHSYPRRLRLVIELLCTVLVLAAALNFGRKALQFLWETLGRNVPDFLNNSLFLGILRWIDNPGNRPEGFLQLIPSVVLLLIALIVSLWIRNFFPTIRTSGRGLLIEWNNGWAPVGWENVQSVRVTEDLAGERYVVLLQTDSKGLTGWHRLYSLLYRLNPGRRGVIITSAITNFMPLVQTIVRELETVARQTNRPPVRLDEKASSPLFQLLLSPAGFFSRQSKADQEYVERAAAASRTAQPGMVTTLMAAYPARIRSLLFTGTSILALLGLFRAVMILRRWLGTQFEVLGRIPIFENKPYVLGEDTWWIPVAAVLVLLLLVPALVVIRNILPVVESRPQGLAVRYFNRWLLIPWADVTAVKSADLSENNHVVLIQCSARSLTRWHAMSSFLFEGSVQRGVLLTSALSSFEPLVQQIVLEVSRAQRNDEREEGLLTEDAPAWMLRLLFKPSEAIDRLVSAISADEDARKLDWSRLSQLAKPMIWVASAPLMMFLVEKLINRGSAPLPTVLINAVVFFLMAFLEWPIVAGLAQALESNNDHDAHHARPFYIYPVIQLPRLLVMGAAIVLLLFGVPVFPSLLWLGAAAWSFLLTAGIWEGLYTWNSTKLLAMGAVPALYQVLLWLGWLTLTK